MNKVLGYITKYRDDNHAYPRIVFQSGQGEKIITLYDFEKSGIFDYIKAGDHLIKPKGSLVFKVIR